MTREERIRALAGAWMMRQWPNKREVTCMAVRAIEKAAEYVDAIDALPVPGRDCASCGGSGTWEGSEGKRYQCGACNRTGKASE